MKFMLSSIVKEAIKEVLASTSSVYERIESSLFNDCHDCKFFLRGKDAYGKCMFFNARKWNQSTCTEFEKREVIR